MNTVELKSYILRHVEGLVNLEITLYEDGSFYLSAYSIESKCGALFQSNGRMHPMARIAFDHDEEDLMDEIEYVAKEFMIRKAA